MPIYEYLCRACGHEFEQLVLKASDAPVCPACNAPDLERLLSGFAVSSEGIRKANVRSARKRFAADPNRLEKHAVERADILEHMAEDGQIDAPPSMSRRGSLPPTDIKK